ncbi:MAG: NAD-dependent epimerase/dehydratase family protein [Polyangiaceae bacterium]
MSGPPSPVRKRVVLAGASGFVGRALTANLRPDHDVIALTRGTSLEGTGVTTRSCDLFNLKEAEAALADADAAFYLVHSMMPSARLTQGTFDDMDLICADNFARAAKKNDVGHVTYLGGLLPPHDGTSLSRHLESRLEVEKTLGAYGTPVTTLRAGLVVGAGGSSFEMMTRLVGRLPVMVGPRWLRSMTQAVALPDVVALLRFAFDHPELAGKAYDVGGPDVLSYADMLRVTGEVLGKRTRILTLPVRSVNLSLLWVSVITGASRELVRPLTESLQHDLVARDGLVLQKLARLHATPLRASITQALEEEESTRRERERARTRDTSPAPSRALAAPPKPARLSRVRSVQRLPLPPGKSARWVAHEYTRWLPTFLAPFLRVEVDATESCRFFLWPVRRPLLVLTYAPDRSADDRQLFYVTDGLLARQVPNTRPRLEFRSVLGGRFVLAAIHDFVPRLPWFIYVFTQALVHLLVMRRFGRHLERC